MFREIGTSCHIGASSVCDFALALCLAENGKFLIEKTTIMKCFVNFCSIFVALKTFRFNKVKFGMQMAGEGGQFGMKVANC